MGEGRIEFEKLPELREILLDNKNLNYVARLFEEAEILEKLTAGNEERLKEIKVSLAMVQHAADVKGMRYGNWVFCEREMPGRETLSRELLIENGVKPSVIAKSLKRGKAFVQRDLRELKK